MILHRLKGFDRKRNNITYCGQQGAATNIRSLVTCNKCRAKMHMKKLTHNQPRGGSSMAKDLFTLAVEGLQEYYPVLSNTDVVKTLKGQVDIPDTGNTQEDYEKVRDSIENLVQKLA